jgi:Trk K+ transport system NAD-binding subunit
MLEHQVLRTIPVGRHVLLIADVLVAAHSELAGQRVEDVHQTGEVRVLALRRRGTDGLDWSPPHDHRLMPQDRLFVLATRNGLSRVVTRSRPR